MEAEGQPYASELRQVGPVRTPLMKLPFILQNAPPSAEESPTPKTRLYRSKSCICGRGNHQGFAVTLSLLGVAFITGEIGNWVQSVTGSGPVEVFLYKRVE